MARPRTAEPRWPTYAAVVGAGAYIAAVQTGTYHPSGDSPTDALIFLVTAPAVAGLCVALGMLSGRTNSLLGVAVVTAALQWGEPNPFPAVITIGFWLVGLAVRSHQRLTTTLHARIDELESSRVAYTQEALRYERVRIARELHDVIAHSLSVIVIQASAGRRLPADDPATSELFDVITDLTCQVRTDLDALGRMFDTNNDVSSSITHTSIDDLFSRTAATGSQLTCHLPDNLDQIPGRLGAVAFRIVQEGLANAIKHAPGAPIEVTITQPSNLRITVTNEPTPRRDHAPAAPGSGHGIAGLAERVHAVHGTLTSGPTRQGGWQLNAELPP